MGSAVASREAWGILVTKHPTAWGSRQLKISIFLPHSNRVSNYRAAMDTNRTLSTIEAKYPYLMGNEPIIRSVLDAVFLKDALHPEDRINSIYFDTRSRAHLAEKVNSDYVKVKVRLRWYGHIEDFVSDHVVSAYLEVKIKNGVQRRKFRQPVEICAGVLRGERKAFEELTELAVIARECGWVPCGQLFPALVVHYDRRRYRNPDDWASLALDRCISYWPINHIFWPTPSPRQLAVGVLEVKSETGMLPRPLWPIRERLSMRDAFSKYEECWKSYTDPFYQRQLRSAH